VLGLYKGFGQRIIAAHRKDVPPERLYSIGHDISPNAVDFLSKIAYMVDLALQN
jgi:hypothetical protein